MKAPDEMPIKDLIAEVKMLRKNKAMNYHFDCWKRDGKIKTKIIIATTINDAKLLFSAKYPDYAYDEPY